MHVYHNTQRIHESALVSLSYLQNERWGRCLYNMCQGLPQGARPFLCQIWIFLLWLWSERGRQLSGKTRLWDYVEWWLEQKHENFLFEPEKCSNRYIVLLGCQTFIHPCWIVFNHTKTIKSCILVSKHLRKRKEKNDVSDVSCSIVSPTKDYVPKCQILFSFSHGAKLYEIIQQE